LKRPPALLLLAALLLAPPVAVRAGTPVEQALARALEQGHADVLGGGTVRLSLETPVEGGVEAVAALTLDPRTGRFAALVDQQGRRLRVEGRAWTEVQVPVPNRRLAPGEVIGAADLSLVPMRPDQLGGRAVLEPAALVGMEVKRTLSPGRLVQAGSVGAPVVVGRNRPVTVEYRSGPLLLTAKGRALQDGGLGDLVRVQNLDSNRTLHAVVTGPGTVSANY